MTTSQELPVSDTANIPLVMGILNVTPDSFSDGGYYLDVKKAIRHGLEMVSYGADIIDIGGESTRPGAQPVSAAQEIDRVVTVIEALRQEASVVLSIDTSKPEVMYAAASAGASIINDVRALRAEGALEAATALGLPVCLMHMQGEPPSMQVAPHYTDVVNEVLEFLVGRANLCMAAGIEREHIIIDPGFGFGKTLQHNLTLLASIGNFAATGFPVLAGLSRKSIVRSLLNSPETDLVTGSVTLALYAARHGAHIVRVHDVRQTVEALRVQAAIESVPVI